MRKIVIFLAIAIPVLCLLGVIIYQLPPVSESLSWRVETIRARIKYILNPPEQVIFVPQPTVATPQPEPSQTPIPTVTPPPPTPLPAATATSTPTPTLTPTPLPAQVVLTGFRHEYQTWNNCAPANLAMALSYWGWKGTQRDIAPLVKPNERDKNVMPYELENFVEQQTELEAVIRVGGELDLLKAFIASGFPVIVEKGFEGPTFDGWMGHYQVVNGFDQAEEQFIAQDSYKGPDLRISFTQFDAQWQAFNYTYIVLYPPEQQDQVLSILGLQAYDNYNARYAEQKARLETQALEGRQKYFAWFNLGANLVTLKDYTAAAAAFDAAFAHYAEIPKAERPWRMMWYQTGPYFAYFYTGRYQDVIQLATTTLEAASEQILEESFYWRGRALLAMGDEEAALEDFRASLEAHPEFSPSLEQFALLGIEP